jgi:hypothetical protein
MKIVFNNNKGELNLNTNEVTFGNITFKSILYAIDYLQRKNIEEKIFLQIMSEW